MSWHSGDWANFSITLTSAIAAVAAAYSAFESGRSAKTSLNYQRDAIKLEREKHLHELLGADASNASGNVRGLDSSAWSFSHIANILNAMKSARQRILEASYFLSDNEIDKLKSYFKSQLSHEINIVFNQIDPPDCLFQPKGPIKLSQEAETLWSINKEFFGYILVSKEDLAD